MSLAALKNRSWMVAAGLLAIAFAIKLAWLTAYPVHNDELISLEAVRGIADYGLPLLDSGKIYYRSLVSHYLLAIPYLLGWEDVFPGRMVSVFFNVLAAGYLYRIVRTLENQAWPAALAAFLFLTSTLINLNTYLLRDYAIFTCFALMTTYYIFRHFVLGEKKIGVLFVLTVLLAGSHDLAVSFLPLLLICAGYACVQQPGYLVENRWKLAGFFLLVAAAFALFVWYRPANAQYAGTALEMKLGGMTDKWFVAHELLNYAPYALIFFAPGLLFGIYSRHRAYLFWGLAILWLALFLSLVSPMANSRYFMPLFALMIGYGSCSAWRVADLAVSRYWRQSRLLSNVLMICSCALTLVFSAVGPGQIFGFSYHYLDAEPVHAFVSEQVPARSLLLSMQPGLTEYYLHRRPDYFLREKVLDDGAGWTVFSEEEKSYIKYDTLDRLVELAALVTQSSHRPVCLVVDYLFDYALSPSMRYFIHRNFELIYKDDQRFAVFLYRPGP